MRSEGDIRSAVKELKELVDKETTKGSMAHSVLTQRIKALAWVLGLPGQETIVPDKKTVELFDALC
jgi:hypothetical protein